MIRYKYPSLAAIKSICAKFDLESPHPFSQDWAHEASAPEKLTDLIQGYEELGLSEEEKFALGTLILSSFDDAYSDGSEPIDAWANISHLLGQDRSIHQYSIHYWCSWDHSDDEIEDAFAITPLMRELKMSSPEEAQKWLNE